MNRLGLVFGLAITPWGFSANAQEMFEPNAGPLAMASPLRGAGSRGTYRADGAWSAPALRRLDLRASWLDIAAQPESEQDSASTEPAAGGDGSGGAADLAKKLQNPVSDLISVPLQFNFDTGFGPKDADRFTLNVQPVIPFSLDEDWNLISRTIVPVIYQDSIADGLDSDFGIGDTVQSFFFSPKEPVGGRILGVGPVALLPTGTDPHLRSEQVGFGPTAVALRQQHGWTYGALANHLWGVNDPNGNERVNATFVQPFVSYTWPTATTLGLNSEATYDWTADELTLPFNLQLSQLTRIGKQPVQLQIGGRWYADSPAGGPEWGLRFAITFLFPK